ncbi:MAG TPA: hypothetical protein VIV12_30100 [Streptosporangiaceae bacterium]
MRATLDTNWGAVELTGRLDVNARTAFTEGHCHSLALALHEKTGWPLIGGVDRGPEYGSGRVPDHVVVQVPDGRLLDITGLHTVEDFEEEWGTVQPLDPAEVAAGFPYQLGPDVVHRYRLPDVETARPYAEKLLRRLNP